MAGEEERWAAEIESAESHRKLLEKKVMDGYDEAMEQLKAAQQQSVHKHFFLTLRSALTDMIFFVCLFLIYLILHSLP